MTIQEYDHAIFVKRIAEIHVPGMRTGRHVRHDSRNRNHPYLRSGQPLKTNVVPRYIPMLNQGNVGACTGNAETGALGSGTLWQALQASAFKGITLDETFALSLYSGAETLDGDGPYPPNDNGSSGPSVAQAAKNAGYITDYVHCFSLQDVLDAISQGKTPILGTNWYDSMDQPDGNGLVTISPNAVVRGGHEYLARGIDVEEKLIIPDNSWGENWGVKGSFAYSWDTLDRLLSETGDATISNPLVTA